jgi:hippurate hydrolase
MRSNRLRQPPQLHQVAGPVVIEQQARPERAPIVEVLRDQFVPATYNNPDLTRRLVAVWKKELGADNVEKTDPVMVTEDFSEYSLPDYSIPDCDFYIGAVDPAKIAESKKTGIPLGAYAHTRA